MSEAADCPTCGARVTAVEQAPQSRDEWADTSLPRRWFVWPCGHEVTAGRGGALRRAALSAQSERAEVERWCGHSETIPECGGCDPGAIDFVITDSGLRRPFDPTRDLSAQSKSPEAEQ